jgi:AcrR family transcriptional regulator
MRTGRRDGTDPNTKKRAQPVSIEEIADTALAILDSDGLEALTMRRLADEIGVKPMTLYRYLPDKEAILAVVADRLWAPLLVIPEGESWRERVRAGWLNLHELMQQHPYATPMLARAGTYSGNAATASARMLNVLREAGFPPELASEVMHTLGATVVGFAFASLWQRETGEGRRPAAPAGEMEPLPEGLLQYAKHVGPSQPSQFESALDLLLEGFEGKLRTAT